MPRSVTPLVGRVSELAALRAAIKGADAGTASAVVVDGDAGVGKTRVLSELATLATEEGFRSLIGHCVDLGDTRPPYLPFTEAIGRVALDDPQLITELLGHAPALARLIPGRAEAAGAARVERGELFEAVLAALQWLAGTAPVLLLVEDVHWADRATVDLIGFLLTRLATERIAVIVSYRSDDLDRRHPLRPTLAQWLRLPAVEHVHLDPLPSADVRQLVGLLQSELAESDIRSIVSRAEGNPFFAEELVAAAEQCQDTGQLPWQLADLLLVRLDRLSTGAREAVRVAAVGGRRVPHQLLAQACELPAGELDAALREAVEAHVLALTSSGRGYVFRHALLAEAVYDDLLPGERMRIHAAYARALAEQQDTPAAELARHARASRDLRTAYAASTRAGSEAMALAAPQEAMEQYQTALELARELTLAESEQARLVAAVVDAAVAAGRWHRGLRISRDALAGLPADAEPMTRAQLLYAAAAAEVAGESDEQTLAATTEALRLVPDSPPSGFRARLEALHAQLSYIMGRERDAQRWAETAIADAEALQLPDVVTDARTTLAKLDQRTADPAEAARRLEELADGARDTGQTASELRSRHTLGSLYYEQGDLERALAAYSQAAARAKQAGRPWAAYGIESRVMAGVIQYVRGDWDAALRTLSTSDDPPEQAHAILVATAMAVHVGRGEADALDALPTVRRRWGRDGRAALHAGSAALEFYEQRARVEDASALLDEVIAVLSALWLDPWTLARVRLSALMLGVLNAAAAGAAPAERQALVDRGATLASDAHTSAERGLPGGRKLGVEGRAWLARADAEWCRLRWLTGSDAPSVEEHLDAWRRAVELFGYGHSYEAARSRARLAAVLRAAGETAGAAEQAAHAREVARALHAVPLQDEIRALGLTPAAQPGRTGQAALTSREQDVLAGLVGGHTNREISRQLYISEKTVSVHVSNILGKLGVRSRNEAAALAHRDGLVG